MSLHIGLLRFEWFSFFNSKCSRQESNLIYDLRKVACVSGTLQELFNGHLHTQASNPSRNRTWSDSFEDCHAVRHNHESFG